MLNYTQPHCYRNLSMGDIVRPAIKERYFRGMGECLISPVEKDRRAQYTDEILSVLPEHVFVFNRLGRCLYVNRSGAEAVGLKRDDVIGKAWQELDLPAGIAGLFGSKLEEVFAGKTLASESEALTAHGTRNYEHVLTPLCREDGNVVSVLVTAKDITNRNRVEKALWESEKRYRALFETAGDAIFILDTEGERAGRIVSANQAAADMHGFTIEELLTLNIRDLDTPDSAKEVSGRIGRMLAGEKLKFEVKHRKKDGTIFPVEVHAGLLELEGHKYILAFDRDITESKRAKELSDALNNINSVINSTLDFNEIMQKVVIESAKGVGSEGGVVLLREGDSWAISYAYGFPEEVIGTKLTDNEARHAVITARTRETVIVGNTCGDERVNHKVMERYGIRSILAVPLILREDVVGALCFCYRSRQVTFAEPEVDFAKKLAASMSLSLENARLYAAERNIADTLQEALLTMPVKIEGIDFGHLYRSATEETKVGGDFYDLFELEHDKIGIVMGDVSGKGIEAATLTALVKNSLRAYALEGYSPALVMARTNNAVVGATSPSLFVTVFFGILNIKTGRLIYCSAGHPPAVLKRNKSEKIRFLSTNSPIIGAFADIAYVDDEAVLKKGDMLILYTDGLIEARCAGGGFFGEEGLAETVKRQAAIPTRDMPKAIFDRVMELSRNKLFDDMAILSISI